MDNAQFKALQRRLDSIEKVQNLQFQDRNILEDILLKIDKQADRTSQLQEEIRLLKEKVEKLEKNSRADIKDLKNEVQETKDIAENIQKDVKLD